MIHRLEGVVLRRPEAKDAERLYQQKNDPEVANQLGGFSRGLCREDVREWIERHRKTTDEVLWILADTGEDQCLGHAGLYRIDHRVRSAEFAIMIGDKAAQGRGLGKMVTRFALEFGFGMLNLNRVELNLLATNERALRLYQGLGFREEGVLRQAQFKNGQYVDVVLMSILRTEFDGTAG